VSEVLRLSRLLVRRHRLMIAAWVVLLCVLTAAAVGQYQTAYPTRGDFEENARLADENVASTLLYGRLRFPGTPGLMFAWELGAFLTILVAVLGVLVAVALTRVEEDEGTVEVLRATGVRPLSPLAAALVVLGAVALVLSLGLALVTAVFGSDVDDIDRLGALCLGLTVGSTFTLFGAIGVLASQVAPTAAGARLLSFAGLGGAFGLRAFADTQQVGWLNWLSPLGLRALVHPFEDDRWLVLVGVQVVVVGLAALALTAARRREYGSGLLRLRGEDDRRLRVRSTLRLLARLGRGSIVVWVAVVASVGTLFSAMGSGVVSMSQSGATGDGMLGSQLQQDPVAGYLAFAGILVALMTGVYAVVTVLRARRDETAGFTDHLWATGVPRWRPLAAQSVITASSSLLVLLVTGTLAALVAPRVIDGDDVAARAFVYVVGQWPAVLVLVGTATLCVGLLPRLSWLAWLPLVASGVLALLGDLLDVPQWLANTGVFRHVPDVSGTDQSFSALFVLVAVALVGWLAGIVGITRRDIRLD
jgi:ABC-2 type transport system permease protein